MSFDCKLSVKISNNWNKNKNHWNKNISRLKTLSIPVELKIMKIF